MILWRWFYIFSLDSIAIYSLICVFSGIIYNFRDGEHGIYLIPNVYFWKSTAKDTLLGLKYCLRMTKYVGKKKAVEFVGLICCDVALVFTNIDTNGFFLLILFFKALVHMAN